MIKGSHKKHDTIDKIIGIVQLWGTEAREEGGASACLYYCPIVFQIAKNVPIDLTGEITVERHQASALKVLASV